MWTVLLMLRLLPPQQRAKSLEQSVAKPILDGDGQPAKLLLQLVTNDDRANGDDENAWRALQGDATDRTKRFLWLGCR